jgi:hypothetical protein
MGKAATAGYRETVGIGRPMSDQGPAGHRNNDGGMSVNGDRGAEKGTEGWQRGREQGRKKGTEAINRRFELNPVQQAA